MIRSGIPGKTWRLRLKGLALTELRMACLVRDKYRCVDCGTGVDWYGFHMAHIQSRGAGGSDVLENVRTKCLRCHTYEHNPKSVPSKHPA